VLAVVERQAVARDGAREPPEDRAALHENDIRSGIGCRQGGCDPGETTSHDADPGRSHGCPPARLRTATTAFSQVGKETRRSVTASGSAAIRVRSRW